MGKHTPGPWFYRPLEYDDWGYVRSAPDAEGRQRIICQARDPLVWGEHDLDAHRRAGTDPWEANARLIAAAPELLEALEDLMASWPEGSLPNGPVCVKAANAIAKAKGEA